MKLTICLLLTLSVLVTTDRAFAQCDVSLQSGDGFAAQIDANGKPIMSTRVEGSLVFPSFLYEIQYEASNIKCRILEFKQNGNRLFLDNWCPNQILEKIKPEAMSKMSRTKNFSVKPNDKLTFYRELWWYLSDVDPNIYYAGHNIGFSVELIDAKTNKRLSLLDTIGLSRQTPAGKPILYAWHPVVKTVEYLIPNNIKSESAFLQVNVYQTGGDEDSRLYRVDGRGINVSGKNENDPWWKSYAETVENYNIFVNKGSRNQSSLISLSSSGAIGKTVTIGISSQVSQGSILQISDANTGEIIFNQLVNGSETISTTINKSGVYIASLSNEGKILESHKILISQ